MALTNDEPISSTVFHIVHLWLVWTHCGLDGMSPVGCCAWIAAATIDTASLMYLVDSLLHRGHFLQKLGVPISHSLRGLARFFIKHIYGLDTSSTRDAVVEWKPPPWCFSGHYGTSSFVKCLSLIGVNRNMRCVWGFAHYFLQELGMPECYLGKTIAHINFLEYQLESNSTIYDVMTACYEEVMLEIGTLRVFLRYTG